MDDFDPNDPDKPNLTPRVERGARAVRYLFRYRVQQMVECAFCPGHTLHRHGFVVQMDDGRIARCGHCCARNFFGDEVAAALDADLRRREKRLEVETFLAPVLVGVEPAIAALDPWLDLERQIDMAASGLIYSGAAAGFRAAVTPTGTIDRIREEIIESEEMGRNGKKRTVRHPRRVIIGRVRGASVFLGHGRCFERACTRLEIIREKGASDTTKLTGNMLDYLKVKRGDAFGLIKEGVERMQAAKAFFTRENIEQLALWCREQGGKVEVRWIAPITGPAIALRARQFDGPVLIMVPTIDAVPALDDLLGHLRRKAA